MGSISDFNFSGLETLFTSLGSSERRGYDADSARKWRERFGTGQERTNIDAPQTGLSAAQHNVMPGPRNITGRQNISNLRTNNPVEVAGLGNVVSDPDGSMYGQSASPALSDYMLPQEQGQTLKEDEAIVQQDIPSSYPEEQQVVQQELSAKVDPDWFWKNQKLGLKAGEPISEELKSIIAEQSKRVQSEPTSGKLNQNIPGNIYAAKHGGSVFRNAYDQASRIMYRAGGGGLEGLRESIDINGQPHNLAYINPTEANLLKVLGGSGQKVNGIPAYYGFGYSNGDTGEGIGGDDEGAATSYESASPAEQEAADMANIASDDFGAATSLESASPEEKAAAENIDWAGIAYNVEQAKLNVTDKRYAELYADPTKGWFNQDTWMTGNKANFEERMRNEAERRGRNSIAYMDDAMRLAGLKGRSVDDLTNEELSDLLGNAQTNWNATEGTFGNTEMSEDEKANRAFLYGQEEYRTDAEWAMKVGISPLDFETIQNTAKAAKEQETEDIREELTKQGDMYGDKPMDLDELMDLNEMYVEQAQKDAVISSVLGEEGISNFNSVENEFELFTGLPATVWDMVKGNRDWSVGDLVRGGIMSLAIPMELSQIVGAVHAFGAMVGETVIGSVDVNDITMNLHESGKLTFQSPEDDPSYDPSSVEGGDDSGLTSLKEERLPVEVEVEEEEDKGTRSIADLVPKRDSSEEVRDYGLELYQSIYGPDENPFV